MSAGPVGIIANPASGKDIRRVVARASVFDNQEKQAIVRRVIAGAVAGGADRFLYMRDGYRIVQEAFEDLKLAASFEAVESPETGSAIDTVRSARAMEAGGVAALITLGGDGTNRAVTLGWQDPVLVPLSTGTNNVFPRMIEGTVAGAAAGLVASGRIEAAEVAAPVKLIHVEIDGEKDDRALIDAVFVNEVFVGARALWDSSRLTLAVLTRAEPAAVGISSIGGLLQPVSDSDDHGLCLRFGAGRTVTAPIAPGLYQPVPIASCVEVAPGEAVAVVGPGVLAFDGERERVLKPGQRATLRIQRDGPRVVDVDKTLALAACRGLFISEPEG